MDTSRIFLEMTTTKALTSRMLKCNGQQNLKLFWFCHGVIKMRFSVLTPVFCVQKWTTHIWILVFNLTLTSVWVMQQFQCTRHQNGFYYINLSNVLLKILKYDQTLLEKIKLPTFSDFWMSQTVLHVKFRFWKNQFKRNSKLSIEKLGA